MIDGKKSPEFNTSANAGRKVAVGKNSSDYKWAKDAAEQHKWVWDKAQGKVVKMRLANSNWSDKITAQETPDQHTAVIRL